MKFGVTFGRLNPRVWQEAAVEADRLGFESIWLPEHLVFPLEMRGQLYPGEDHPPVPPTTPILDVGAYLGWIAAQTEHIRLGTFVYLLAIRHPFTAARVFATLDVVSGGRAEAGVGAGWLVNEWEAVGLDPRSRGRRLDEAMDVCRRLWSEDVVEHHGEFFDFEPVAFEPKPVQPRIPVLVGGESDRAMRRAGTRGDGWIGMHHTVESVKPRIDALRAHAVDAGRDADSLTVTVGGSVDAHDDVAAWEAVGVDRLIVTPWSSSREALDRMRAFAAEFL